MIIIISQTVSTHSHSHSENQNVIVSINKWINTNNPGNNFKLVV